ncbi:hypothetical protein HJB84_27455 [Rhizobium sp. NZLR1b]|uniref:hypothetical protein n=1 Tax=unclassified Rhizobium TaxID=2613769 RepID=UPI001C83417B|nr:MULTISPECIES: hypothetical protein [unclassified Rhizobium]MBX5173550.1 hypothetical protein [Rhizobium sp. NZLR1b]MBX5192656.1 hypothetical protein [Rhizobium sp. NZLR3b]
MAAVFVFMAILLFGVVFVLMVSTIIKHRKEGGIPAATLKAQAKIIFPLMAISMILIVLADLSRRGL